MSYCGKDLFLSIWSPDPIILLQFGAKDPVGLANHEIWRFITPVFVHIGIIHFLFNSFALYIIGFQLECVLGPIWFLVIYLASGIFGNITSSLFTVSVSAGASGALFGLLGAGYYLERVIGQRFKEITGRKAPRGIYFGMVLLNIAFGFLIPGIDNAAHIGGLIAGITLTVAMINVRPNHLRTARRPLGIAVVALLLIATGVGAYIGSSKTYISSKIESIADEKSDALIAAGDTANYQSVEAIQANELYSQAIAILPDNMDLRFKRGRFLMFAGDYNLALHDLRIAALDDKLNEMFESFILELEKRSKRQEAWQVRRLLEHSK